MAGVSLGLGTCPVCGSAKAKFSFSEKTQLSYVTCNTCNFQGFSRSDNSDARLRSLVHAAAPAEPVAVEKPAPAPAEKIEKTKPESKGFTWGVLTS